MLTKKFTVLLVLSTALLTQACRKQEKAPHAQQISIPESDVTPLSVKEINSRIDQAFTQNGSFSWKSASDHLVWSAIVNGQFVATVGFGKSTNDFDRSKSPNAAKTEQELLDLIQQMEGKPLDKILINSDPYLNLFDVIIEKQETVIALRKNSLIRYLEPADYRYMENSSREKSGSGCGFSTATLAATDFTTVSPNAKVPWAFYQHNIPSAWSITTGAGVTIGVIDTGVSPEQSMMQGSFNSGASSGRTIERYGVYVNSIWPWSTSTDGPDDQCGHGTSMTSVATSPRNNSGQPVGVAYNASLVAYRAASDVLLEGYHEQNGVKNAYVALGNNSNVKIISMSMGYIMSVGKIEDGVKYAYSKGKLIFCAGGTSTTFTNFVGVIFPAWMPEAVAVTGVKDGSSYQRCDICHSGSKIDFTIVMEHAGSGTHVPVNSYYNAQSDYVGGSSVATATTAGIAALVWASHPGWTRAQVFDRMKQSSDFYPNRDPEFGYGNIDAYQAVQP